jgi:hypothetical protein
MMNYRTRPLSQRFGRAPLQARAFLISHDFREENRLIIDRGI